MRKGKVVEIDRSGVMKGVRRALVETMSDSRASGATRCFTILQSPNGELIWNSSGVSDLEAIGMMELVKSAIVDGGYNDYDSMADF